MRHAALSLALLCLLGSPAGAQRWADRAGLTPEEILATADRLAQQIAMPPPKHDELRARLWAVVTDGRVARRGLPVRGVFAYQSGEGGFLYKVRNGYGLLAWQDDAAAWSVSIKGKSFGAQIGGSSEWGFGLVLGDLAPEGFGGEYTGGTASATIGGAGTGMMELTSRIRYGAPYSKVYLIGAASGASANAGTAKLTLVATRLAPARQVAATPECRMGADGMQACGYHCLVGSDGRAACANTADGVCAISASGAAVCSQVVVPSSAQ